MHWRRWISRGLMVAFLALFGISLTLPSMVLYETADSRVISSESELSAELERGSYCRVLGDAKLHLTPDHEAATADGIPLSWQPSKTIACTSKIVRPAREILYWGWLGPLIGIFAWYANLLALVSVILSVIGRTPKAALVFALGAVLLGLDTFRFHGEPSMGMGPAPFLDHLESGYYVWEFSFVMLLLSQLAMLPLRKASADHQPATI